MNTETKSKFKLGQIVSTPGALEALQRNNTDGGDYIRRHAACGWGAICEEDVQYIRLDEMVAQTMLARFGGDLNYFLLGLVQTRATMKSR